jgi:fluoroacetyl-CoA thioesterase
MHAVPIGNKGRFTLKVCPQHLASEFKDPMLPPVLATPVMIMMMENAAFDAIWAYLETNESALGIAVDIRHLAATPIGCVVTAEAEVVQVEGRRLHFAVTAHDGFEQIGSGTHERMVVDLQRLTRRLEAKGVR